MPERIVRLWDGDIERVLRRAKQRAQRLRCGVDVVVAETGVRLAEVFPDGRIDATFAGSEYISIVPREVPSPGRLGQPA